MFDQLGIREPNPILDQYEAPLTSIIHEESEKSDISDSFEILEDESN